MDDIENEHNWNEELAKPNFETDKIAEKALRDSKVSSY